LADGRPRLGRDPSGARFGAGEIRRRDGADTDRRGNATAAARLIRRAAVARVTCSRLVAFNIAHMMVDDADAPHAICQRHGLRIIKRIQDKDYGLRAFVFEDPDGNRIDVGQPI
jgi:catechol 2,3-dioxygenase-like lactoylglutathione lyase family enzyme